MKVIVVDYEAGNIKSICGLLRAAAALANVRAEIKATKDPECVANCDKLVLPGVGSYQSCYNKLKLIPNMIDAIVYAARKVEFLGICVGMQLLSSVGFEEDKRLGLGLLPGIVSRLDSAASRIPHMGWNSLIMPMRHYLLTSLPMEAHACKAYFVHSYEYIPLNYSNVLATTIYNKAIVAAVVNNNIVGVQFHPEKSHWFGIRLCANFLSWHS
ncbi:MAG: imidazole glycerol phosphate synthase subunit HisH [Candidatus Hodgkinia cicadicola]